MSFRILAQVTEDYYMKFVNPSNPKVEWAVKSSTFLASSAFLTAVTNIVTPLLPSTDINVTNIFVDPAIGDDGTGTINRLDLPFQTLTAAYAAATAGVRTLVYCRRGDYTDTITLKDLVDIYFESGSVYSTGRLIVSDPDITVKVTGSVDFESNSSSAINMTTASTGSRLTFECNTYSVNANESIDLRSTTDAYLLFKANRVNVVNNSSNGRTIRLDNQAHLVMDVSESITTNRALLYFRNTPTGASAIINTPDIVMTGAGAIASAFQNYLVNVQGGNEAHLTINANVTYIGSSLVSTCPMFMWLSTGTFRLKGNVVCGDLIGVENWGNFYYEGKMTSDRPCIIHASTGKCEIRNSIIQSGGLAEPINSFNQTIVLGASMITDVAYTKIYFESCTLINNGEDNDGIIMLDRDGGGINRGGIAYLYDCECWSNNPDGAVTYHGVVTASRIAGITTTNAGATLDDGIYRGISADNIVGTGTGAAFDVVVSGGSITKIILRDRGWGYAATDTFNFATAITGVGHTEVFEVDSVAAALVGPKDTVSNVDHIAGVESLFNQDIVADPNFEVFIV